MVKLADTLALGASGAIRAGSSPVPGTTLKDPERGLFDVAQLNTHNVKFKQ
jgi:hypothetical protein